MSITVGEGIAQEKPADSQNMVGAFDEERYNKYLFDASGPKRKDVLSQPVDETDAVCEDLASFYGDGAYSVKNSGERFAVGAGIGMSTTHKVKMPSEIEQEELAAALEQIRKLEEVEMFKGT